LQAGGSATIDQLHSICKEIWDKEIIPEEWCKSLVITIPKKGDQTSNNDYSAGLILSLAMSGLHAHAACWLVDLCRSVVVIPLSKTFAPLHRLHKSKRGFKSVF